MLFHHVPPCPPLISGSFNDERDQSQLVYATNDTSVITSIPDLHCLTT